LSREYLTKGFEDTEVQHYYKFMVDSAVLLGAESEEALKELKESLLFEIGLANITVPKEERRNASVLYNPTTLGELPILEALPPSWVTYIQILFENADKVTIDDNEKIIITDLEYFNKLSNLLKNTKSEVEFKNCHLCGRDVQILLVLIIKSDYLVLDWLQEACM